ncbi:hypothetical protein TWF703_010467 [Orbilia oligospora]|uniref:Uncharacterized protein n=1 Tax=Orbilia oligospora TaxID=2813651 RepID=A0A7C8P1S0_ORBOL|nr:hypothetical protein TWF703_010467 [Orbilia oligospora]
MNPFSHDIGLLVPFFIFLLAGLLGVGTGSPIANPAASPQLLSGILGPILDPILGGGGGGGGGAASPALYNFFLGLARNVLDPALGTDLAGQIMPGTTLDGGRGILGPEVCALFNCAVNPSGGPVQGGSDTLSQVAALLDRLLGTNIVRVIQGGATSRDVNGLVGPLVCLLFSCSIGPQVTTTLTATSTATSVSTFTISTTRLSTTTLTTTCSPTTLTSSIFTTTTNFVTLTSSTTATVFATRTSVVAGPATTITSTSYLTYKTTYTQAAPAVTKTSTVTQTVPAITYTTTATLPGYPVTKTVTSTWTSTVTKCTSSRPYRRGVS